MTVVLTGVNDFARVSELKKITADFVKQYGDFGVEQIDAAETELGRLLETVASQPFLAERRMVIVHNLNANKSIFEKIEQLLDAVSETTDLVIVEPKFDKRLSLYKTLKKRTDFQEFTELDEKGLVSWIIRTVQERGGSIKPNDANYLVGRVGTNQMGLGNELDKLLSFDLSITKEVINMLTEPLPQSTVFELLDAAFSGNHKRALELYQDQRKQQVEPQAIMGMIAWQLHILSVVKFNEKDEVETIAKQARINPYVVRKSLGITRNLTLNKIKNLVERALKLDVRLKSENLDADDAVQHFLLTI